MCNLCRDAAVLEDVDSARMTRCSQEIIDLFKNEVYITIINDYDERAWESASSDAVLTFFKENYQSLKYKIKIGEKAVRQLNSCWLLSDRLRSFRLVCNESRIFTFLLDQNFSLIIINRNTKDKHFEDPPDFDKKLNELVKTVKASLVPKADTHVK